MMGVGDVLVNPIGPIQENTVPGIELVAWNCKLVPLQIGLLEDATTRGVSFTITVVLDDAVGHPPPDIVAVYKPARVSAALGMLTEGPVATKPFGPVQFTFPPDVTAFN